MLKVLSNIFLLFSLFACQTIGKNPTQNLQQGDLLFKDTRNNSMANAIKEVTPSLARYSFSHVAVAVQENGEWKVLEAVPGAGVRLSPLASFLSPAKGEVLKVVVGRLKKTHPFDLQQLIMYGKQQIGKPYDEAFVWDTEKFYCSELVYQMFAHAGQASSFSPAPMTFKEKGKKTFHPTWSRYFQRLHLPIPEGATGINPNAMAKARSLTILFELP